MGTSALFFKPSEVHPCPGPELWERERDTELWGQKEQDAEKENKTENGGVGSCKSATFFSLLISRRAYYLPRDRQTCSSKAYSGNDQCCRSSWNPLFQNHLLRSSREQPQLLFFFLPPADIMLDMNLRQWNQKSTESANLTFGCETWRGHWRNECMSDRNMRFWFDEDTLWGRFFFFFLFNPPVCLHR